ncbi:MAG: SRPBCC family protein [Actinomycetes bacterium]
MEPTPVRRVIAAKPDAVAEVLSDGWLYASWVVGASRIRAVDPEWPRAGSSLAHSVGLWPMLVSDTTSVLLEDLPRRLELQARAWPAGEGHVVLTIEEIEQSTKSLVSIWEWATKGPARSIPSQLQQPAIRYRNIEALRRLGMLAEGRSASQSGETAP